MSQKIKFLEKTIASNSQQKLGNFNRKWYKLDTKLSL